MVKNPPNLPLSLMRLNDVNFPLLLKIKEGSLPPDLQGHMFIVAPVGTLSDPYGTGIPLLNGTGKIYRIDFNKQGEKSEPGKAFILAKDTKTPCYYADRITNTQSNEIWKFRDFGIARISPRLGLYNQINTGLQPFRFPTDEQDRLLVTWDVGRPYEVDPLTLELITPIGAVDNWVQPDDMSFWPFPFIFSTAHPVFDPIDRRELFTVQYAGMSERILRAIRYYETKTAETRQKLRQQVEPELRRLQQDVTEEEINKHEDYKHLIALNLLNLMYPNVFSDLDSAEVDVVKDLRKAVDIIKADAVTRTNSTNHRIKSLINEAETKEQSLDKEFGLRKDHSTYLIRWNGNKDLKKWKVEYIDGAEIKPVKIQQTIHQMGLSKDYIVLIDTAFKLSIDGVFYSPEELAECTRPIFGKPQLDKTILYIINRADLNNDFETVTAKRITIPRETGHFLLNYENPDNQITLHVAHMCASDSAEWLRKFDRPPAGLDVILDGFKGALSGGPTDINYAGRYVIDAKTGVILKKQGDGEQSDGERVYGDQTWGLALYTHYGAFSAIWDGAAPKTIDTLYWISWGCTNLQTKYVHDLYKDYKYRTIPLEDVINIASNPGKPAASLPSLFKLQTRPDKKLEIDQDFYSFPPKCTVNSPQFIPRNSNTESSTSGYIVCIVISDLSENNVSTGDEIWIFKAESLKQGPICKLSHPDLNFGFSLHTAWLPNVQKLDPTKLGNIIKVKDDFFQRVERQNDDSIKSLFEEIYKEFAP
ncbi:carotenoid oxygenase family protein [uncultured Nostoc sp.]|uniref:carotenoid oxygenase family protein n=1 Tax=uncultured Nostoc sp. TaxID=340711 RepID=UPI0035CA7657